MITAHQARKQAEQGATDEYSSLYQRINRASSSGHRVISTRNYAEVEAKCIKEHFEVLGYEVSVEEWKGFYDEPTVYSLVIRW